MARARKPDAANSSTISLGADPKVSKLPVSSEASGSGKRKGAGSGGPVSKKAKTTSQGKLAEATIIINKAPKKPLSVFVSGTGEHGELGLGPKEVTTLRSRLNPYLNPSDKRKFHAVQVACGSKHSIVLTTDNQIVTWGANHNGALGRDTEETKPRSKDKKLNPLESTPTAISAECFPSGTTFVQVAAGESCSFSLTETGEVYGWGAFIDSSRGTGFGYDVEGKCILQQDTPVRIPVLEKITQIICGANHAMALDTAGDIWAWGANELGQLGRLNGNDPDGLKIRLVDVCPKNAKYIASGDYHSFAVDEDDNVWAWGRNSHGETGYTENLGKDSDLALPPTKISDLCGKGIRVWDGGAHHSAAVTAHGECLVWGRIDSGQLGIEFTIEQLQDGALVRHDEHSEPTICLRPTVVPGIGKAAFVSCGTDHTILINKEGHAFATGIGSGGQLGLGNEEDLSVMSRIGGTIKNRKLTWAGAGGLYSVVTAVYERPKPKEKKKWATGEGGCPTWFEIY
ncbi:Fc.00g106880.m01.CDS01 [Cosmosporella sp. VM-42]